MVKPAKVSASYVHEFGAMLDNNIAIDEFTYHYVIKNLGKSQDANDVSAVGFAYALHGEDELAYKHFNENLKVGGATVAGNFAAFLFKCHHYKKLYDIIYKLADEFGGKMLTMLAAGESYRMGDIHSIKKYMEWHCSLLTNEDDKEGAEEYMRELLDGVQSCYDAKICTPEQFKVLGELTHLILEERKLTPGTVGVYSAMGGDYLVQVQKTSPSDIVVMNMLLAERICSEPLLDDCEMTARFSVEREDHEKASYDY